MSIDSIRQINHIDQFLKKISAGALITLVAAATIGIAGAVFKSKSKKEVKGEPSIPQFKDRYNSLFQEISKIITPEEVYDIIYEICPFPVDKKKYNLWFESLNIYQKEFKDFAVSHLLSRKLVTGEIQEKIIAHFSFDKIAHEIKLENMQATNFYQLLSSYFGMMPTEACRAVEEEIEKIISHSDENISEFLHQQRFLMRSGAIIAQFRIHIALMIYEKLNPEKIQRLKKAYVELIIFWINNMDKNHHLLIPLGIKNHMVPIAIYKTDQGEYMLTVIDTGGFFKLISKTSNFIKQKQLTEQIIVIKDCKSVFDSSFWEELLDIKLFLRGVEGMRDLLEKVCSSGKVLSDVVSSYNLILHEHLQKERTCTISSLLSLVHFNARYHFNLQEKEFDDLWDLIQKRMIITISQTRLKEGTNLLFYYRLARNKLQIVRKKNLSCEKVFKALMLVYKDEEDKRKKSLYNIITELHQLETDKKWRLVVKCLAFSMNNKNFNVINRMIEKIKN